MLLIEGKIKPKLVTYTKKKNGDSNVWYLDNGVSNRMTGEISKFKDLNEKVTRQVHFGDESIVSIKGNGSVIFKCKNGVEKLFREVYYIPNLCNNILSLGQLFEEGNLVVMYVEFLWVYDNEGKLLLKVKRSGNRLYKIII